MATRGVARAAPEAGTGSGGTRTERQAAEAISEDGRVARRDASAMRSGERDGRAARRARWAAARQAVMRREGERRGDGRRRARQQRDGLGSAARHGREGTTATKRRRRVARAAEVTTQRHAARGRRQ